MKVPTICKRTTVYVALSLVMASGCASVTTRNGPPEGIEVLSYPYGIEDRSIRSWGDSVGLERSAELSDTRIENMRAAYSEALAKGEKIEEYALALSGGGPDGAYGAGLLNGWTENGTRPEFRIVTGISTGAIIALFAYLGPAYNDALEEVYTEYTTDDLLETTILSGIFGGSALTDTTGYRALIERYITDDVVTELAREWEKRRFLLIGTTHLDASRPVVWNIGAIAATGDPNAKTLIQDIIQASSAIPVAFPPQLIPVTTDDGQSYDEMHVDGGATNQVILFSPEFSLEVADEALGVPVETRVFIVANNKLDKPHSVVEPDTLSIAGAAISSLIGGDAAGDIYRIFAITERDEIDFNLTFIPLDFKAEPKEAFDPVYMKALYDLGYDHGREGVDWKKYPPDYKPRS